MSEENLPPCKECHDPPTWAMYPYQAWIMHKPYTDCAYGKKNVAMPSDLWRLIHTPDPIIAELRNQVHELERMLDEAQAIAANQEFAPIYKAGEHGRIVAKDLAGTPIWDLVANGAQYVPESALKNVPPDGASKHDKYLYGKPENQ